MKRRQLSPRLLSLRKLFRIHGSHVEHCFGNPILGVVAEVFAYHFGRDLDNLSDAERMTYATDQPFGKLGIVVHGDGAFCDFYLWSTRGTGQLRLGLGNALDALQYPLADFSLVSAHGEAKHYLIGNDVVLCSAMNLPHSHDNRVERIILP